MVTPDQGACGTCHPESEWDRVGPGHGRGTPSLLTFLQCGVAAWSALLGPLELVGPSEPQQGELWCLGGLRRQAWDSVCQFLGRTRPSE